MPNGWRTIKSLVHKIIIIIAVLDYYITVVLTLIEWKGRRWPKAGLSMLSWRFFCSIV